MTPTSGNPKDPSGAAGVQASAVVKPDAAAASKTEKKNHSRARKITRIFEDATFIKRLQELIESGILNTNGGAEALRAKLNGEFFSGESRKLTKKNFDSRLEGVIWSDKKRSDLLSSAVKYDVPLKEIYPLLHYIPQKLIDREAKRLNGVMPAGKPKKKDELFEAGVGRLVTDEEIARGEVHPLKQYTLEKPFKLAVRDPKKFNLMFIQPLVGVQYDRRIDNNPVRNQIRYAERMKFDNIILPAGLIWLDLVKSGDLITHRAEISSFKFDQDYLDPDYREKALEIRKTLPPDQMIFITLREQVMSIIYGAYRQLMFHKDGTPIFSGKVYFLFGRLEWNLILAASNAHATYIMRKMQNFAKGELAAARSKLAYVIKASGKDSSEAQTLEKEIARLTKEEQRYRVANVYKQDRQHITNLVRSNLVQWFSEAIPNSEFITQGDAVCSVGDQIINISHVHDEKALDNALAKRVQGSGIRELAGRLPNVDVIAGPYNLNMRYSSRERIVVDKDTSVRERRTTHLVQLPVAVDREHARDALKHLTRSATAYEKLIFDARFEPGSLHLQFTDGVWEFHKLPMEMFTARKVLGLTDKESTPYIYKMANGDEHAGSRSRMMFRDAETGTMVPLEVALSLIFERNFINKGKPVPIHGFTSTGDQTQGHHFETQQGVHPKQRSLGDEQERLKELLMKSKRMGEAELREMVTSLAEDHIFQMTVRGEDWPIRQLIDYMKYSLRPRDKFLYEILRTHQRAHIKVVGIGEAQPRGRKTFDARDMGAVNFVGGNHMENTTDKEITEGPIFSTHLIALIRAIEKCQFTEKELEQLVKAPLWGDIPIGYGLWSVPGKHSYTWGMQIRHDPARKSKQNADPLLNELNNTIETGDYSRIFTGRHWVGISGDVHRMGAAFGPGFTFVSCGACTDGDHYGAKLGFSRSTAGAVVIGLPAWGPASGPLRFTPITHDFIRRYLAKPWDIDWDAVFPKPA